MCHAASWIISEVRDGHGHIWKSWASLAGRAFPEIPPVTTCHSYTIETKYTYRYDLYLIIKNNELGLYIII